MAWRGAADTAISSELSQSILDDEQEDGIIMEPGGISIQMEVRLRGSNHMGVPSGHQETSWNYVQGMGKQCNNIPQIFAKMADLGYEAIVINHRRLEDCARASRIDISSDGDVTVWLSGARGEASKKWAVRAIAPGGWYSFKELQNDPSSMQKLFATARAC
eukprot:2762351-Rhodomonas_salina.3